MKKILLILLVLILVSPAIAAEGVEFTATPGLANLYFRVYRQSDGLAWDDVGNLFETFGTSDVEDYSIDLVEQGSSTSGYYTGTLSGIDEAHITAIAYNNGTPAVTDVPIGASDTIAWDGTNVQKVITTDGEVTVDKTGYVLSSTGNADVITKMQVEMVLDPTDFQINLIEWQSTEQNNATAGIPSVRVAAMDNNLINELAGYEDVARDIVGTPSSTVFQLAVSSAAVDDYYNGQIINVRKLSGDTWHGDRVIKDYVAVSQTVTLYTPLPFTPTADLDTYRIKLDTANRNIIAIQSDDQSATDFKAFVDNMLDLVNNWVLCDIKALDEDPVQQTNGNIHSLPGSF